MFDTRCYYRLIGSWQTWAWEGQRERKLREGVNLILDQRRSAPKSLTGTLSPPIIHSSTRVSIRGLVIRPILISYSQCVLCCSCLTSSPLGWSCWISFNTHAHSEACFCCELELKWGAHILMAASQTCRLADLGSNLASHSCDPSTLPLSLQLLFQPLCDCLRTVEFSNQTKWLIMI